MGLPLIAHYNPKGCGLFRGIQGVALKTQLGCLPQRPDKEVTLLLDLPFRGVTLSPKNPSV